VSVAFMLTHLDFSCVQKAFKTRLSADQNLLRIFQLLWNLFSFLESLINLLDGSIIFFTSSRYFNWIHHTICYVGVVLKLFELLQFGHHQQIFFQIRLTSCSISLLSLPGHFYSLYFKSLL
jgi:uncharacterized membrane protein